MMTASVTGWPNFISASCLSLRRMGTDFLGAVFFVSVRELVVVPTDVSLDALYDLFRVRRGSYLA